MNTGRNVGFWTRPTPAGKTCCDASFNNLLEELAVDGAVAETLVAGARAGRMIGQLVLDTQPAKPSVCKIDLCLAAERPLRANGEHIADDQHLHEFERSMIRQRRDPL